MGVARFGAAMLGAIDLVVKATSFDAAGNEVDSCTIAANDIQCALTIPASEDGSYAINPGAGFEDLVLVSSTPESTGEGGDGREWTFVPADDDTEIPPTATNSPDDAEMPDTSVTALP